MPFQHKRERSTSSDFESAAKPCRRIVLACVECRNRRCKCDGAQPSCSNCVKHGRPACEYKAVTAEENIQARRRKNYPILASSTITAKSSKAHRSGGQRRSKQPKRARNEDNEDVEDDDAEGEDDEEYRPMAPGTEEKVTKRRRVSSSSSSAKGSSSTHTPIPLLPMPSALPPALDTTSPIIHEQSHQPHYFSYPPTSISLPSFVPAGIVPLPYPTPFSPPTAAANLGTPHQTSQQPSHPSYFPFHYPSAPQQQFILFQPPPSSPPSAYHQPLPYSHPNYPQAGYMVHQPLPTPYWPHPPSADGGYPFPTSTMPSSFAYVSTGAPVCTPGLGMDLHYPIYEPQPTVIYPGASNFSPFPCSTSTFAPPAPNTSTSTPVLRPIESPAQLPTPSSGPSSPTLANAPSVFDLSLGLEELVDAPLQAATTMGSKMEKQWSEQQGPQRIGTPFETRFGGGEAEWTC